MASSLETDVLIIGAGPAGSTAATLLSAAGLKVLLIDQDKFPREKACGGGLITDTLKALKYLDLKDAVFKSAYPIKGLLVFSPNRQQLLVRGDFASIYRVEFDEILRGHALKQGTQFLAPYRLVGSLQNEDGVIGGKFRQSENGQELTIYAKVTLLATGSTAKPLELYDVCMRKSPSAVACRAIYQSTEESSYKSKNFIVSFEKYLCPGYGWVFPGPNGSFNIGVGYFFTGKRKPFTANLKKLWQRFVVEFPIADEIVSKTKVVAPLKGGFLRTGLTGAKLSRPGLLVLGDAAGLVYPFSGEGIGKAMESGIIAATLVKDFFFR